MNLSLHRTAVLIPVLIERRYPSAVVDSDPVIPSNKAHRLSITAKTISPGDGTANNGVS